MYEQYRGHDGRPQGRDPSWRPVSQQTHDMYSMPRQPNAMAPPPMGSSSQPRPQQQPPGPAPPEPEPYRPHRIKGMDKIFRDRFESAIKVTTKNGTEFVAFDMAAIQSFILFHLQTMIVGATDNLCQETSGTRVDEIVRYLGARMHDYCM
jgi:hypothetical protein